MSADIPNDKVDANNREFRALIDNNNVGGIIGKAGANVKRVRDESGAFVSIMKTDNRNVQDRVMILRGSHEQIANAARLVAQLIIEANAAKENKTDSNTASFKLLVHRSAVGAVIGKSGATIKDTQNDTGARVQVANEPLPNSTEKPVTISGTPDQVHAAVSRILDQLAENPLRAGTKSFPYVPGAPSYPSNGYGAPTSYVPPVMPIYHQGQFAANPNAPPSTQKIAIPTVCAGCVIGKKGQVIRDLRTQSQTNISIADPDPTSPNERVVTLTGTPAGIQHAVYMIRQLVEQYQPPAQPQQQDAQQY